MDHHCLYENQLANCTITKSSALSIQYSHDDFVEKTQVLAPKLLNLFRLKGNKTSNKQAWKNMKK